MAQDMGRGIIAPDSNDNISTTGVQEMRTLAAAAAQAIDDADFKRGTLPTGTNADDLSTPGQYYTGGVTTAQSHFNLAVPLVSDILVLAGSSTYSVTQLQIPSTTADNSIYYRSKQSSSSWTPWTPLNLLMGNMSANSDADDLHRPGFYRTGSSSNAQTIDNLAVQTASNFIVMGHGGAAYTSQLQIPVTNNGAGLWVRSKRSSTAWGPWINLAEAGQSDRPLDTGHYGTPNVQRIEDFKEEYPLVSTGGKGVVSFRWDHGLTNFKEHLLPLHESLGVPCIIAMNSRTWDDAQNSGMTQTEAAALAQGGLVEWANHTADHQDRNTEDGMYDNIVNGRIELEDQLGVLIHHFIIPGASPTGLGGLVTAPNLDRFSQTYAGSLILAHHAVSSGNFPGTQMRVMDGTIRQGQSHYSIDTRSVAEVKAQIDQAVSQKRNLWIMGHPSRFGSSGYISVADVQEIMRYVKQLVDAGELANITPNQSMHATTAPLTPEYRVDTSVGTRVYVGDTMIYGDTGWRDISDLIEDSWSGTALIKRENDKVSISASLYAHESIHGSSRADRRRILRLPTGFYGTGILSYQGAGYGLVHGILIGIDMAWANYMLDVTARASDNRGDLGEWDNRLFRVNYTFPVDANWPTSLPGLPA